MGKLGSYFKSMPGRIILVIMVQWLFFFTVFLLGFCTIILSLATRGITFDNVLAIVNVANVYAWITLGTIWVATIFLAKFGRFA